MTHSSQSQLTELYKAIAEEDGGLINGSFGSYGSLLWITEDQDHMNPFDLVLSLILSPIDLKMACDR